MKSLNEFKKEFIKILKKQYDDLDKKDLKKDKSLEKSLMWLAGDVFIEKGRAANIGEVREWKGRKFKKIAPNKWRPIYESNTRGAKQSIKLLAKKVSKAQSVDELLEIVMQNVNRFTDANGKTLDIVSELKNAVKEAKGRLNAGKPTAQQKIDDFNKKNSILSEDERKTLMSGVYGAKVKEILTSKSDEDLKKIFEEAHNSKNPFFEKYVYREINRRKKENEKKEQEATFKKKSDYYGEMNFTSQGKNRMGYSVYTTSEDGKDYKITMGKWGASWEVSENGKKLYGSDSIYHDGKLTLKEAKEEIQKYRINNKPDVPENAEPKEEPKQKKEPEKKEKKSTGKLKIPEGIDGIPTKDSDGIVRISNIADSNDYEIRTQYLNDNRLNGSELAIDPTNWSDKIFDLGRRIKELESYDNPARADVLKKLKSDFKKLSKLKSDFNNLPKAEKVKLLEKNIETLKVNKAKVAPYLTEAVPNIEKWTISSIERVFDTKIKAMESALTRAKKGQILENTFKTDGIVDGNGNYVRCYFWANYKDGNIHISARNYDHLPKTLQTDTDFIKNDSDSYTDYFDSDRMTITPSNPYYNEAVKAAFKQEYKKDIAAYKKATENNRKLVKNGGELKEEETKESKIVKIGTDAVETLKKLKADFIDFEKRSGIDRRLVEDLFKGKAPEKNEEKTKTEEWVSPLPKYENNLSVFDDDELKEIAEREKDETKLKVINHVMKQRGLKKSFSEKIYEVIKNIKVHSN